jgi:hypothetical protein
LKNRISQAHKSRVSPSTSNYKAFAPGGTVISKLGNYNKAVSGSVKTNACEVMTSPYAGEAVNIALTDTTIVGGVINLAAGFAIGTVIEKVLPPVLNAIISVIPSQKILGYFLGDLTKDISGEKIGDALASGASHVMGQTANDGGNMPLTVKEAVAYENATKQVQLAYAEEDRATLSPFDISNPNTMLGSIVQKLIPYYTSANSTIGSIAHNFSFISNLVIGSFGTALQPLSASADSVDTSQYELCDDPMISDSGVAAGPYCNIIYGVPTQYLDKDPSTVLQELISSGEVDPETGEPVKDKGLQAWEELCTDGSTDTLKSCEVTDKTANYALYTIDRRVQKSLDGEGAATSSTESAQ